MIAECEFIVNIGIVYQARKVLISLFMSLRMRVSQRAREGHHGVEGPATLAVNRGIFLGAPRPVERHRRHWLPWPSIISYPALFIIDSTSLLFYMDIS